MLGVTSTIDRVVILSLIWLALAKVDPVQDQNELLRITFEGSEEAEIKNFPYVVALYKQIVGKKSFICTASILHKNWVLTAAHCVDQGEVGHFEVKAGFDKIAQLFNTSLVQSRPALEIKKHPHYWVRRVSKYDVALIKVDSFNFNDRVNSILTYAQNWAELTSVPGKEYRENKCTTVGWGSLEFGVPSKSLRYANMTVWHGTDACRCFDMYEQRRLICSNAKELKGICPGDSGGPLVCNKSVAGVAHVIYNRDSCSYSHFGKLELKCNSDKVISAWMYVCPMLNFINEHVPDTPKTPESCQSPPKQRLSLAAIFPIIFSHWSH